MTIMQPIASPEMLAVIRERDAALAELEQLRAKLGRSTEEGVTVCVPVYQDYTYLEQTLASIAAQTVQPLDILVINDGSGPAQTEMIKGLAVKYGAVHYRVTNRGLPNARNTALMLARGHAFLPLDADDWLEPTYIEKTLPLLVDADVVLTGLQEHGPDRNSAYMPGYDRHYSQVTVDLLVHGYNRFFYASLFRVGLLREIGGYHGKMAGGWGVAGGYEDWDVWIDLLKRGVRLAAVQEPLLNYRTRVDSMLAAAERNRAILVEEILRHHA